MTSLSPTCLRAQWATEVYPLDDDDNVIITLRCRDEMLLDAGCAVRASRASQLSVRHVVDTPRSVMKCQSMRIVPVTLCANKLVARASACRLSLISAYIVVNTVCADSSSRCELKQRAAAAAAAVIHSDWWSVASTQRFHASMHAPRLLLLLLLLLLHSRAATNMHIWLNTAAACVMAGSNCRLFPCDASSSNNSFARRDSTASIVSKREASFLWTDRNIRRHWRGARSIE